MALSGNQKAYLQARSGIARSAAIRSNYVFPLFAVVSVNGIDFSSHIRYGTLRVTMGLNDEPDTASFEIMLTDPTLQSTVVVGADVLIGLGGLSENPVFGGRILTTQTTRGPAKTPSVRSVLCADYLQVLDSEYLVTYDWPAQSATLTIRDLLKRFTQKPAGVPIDWAGVPDGLPSHAAIAVANEKFSTLLRRLVTMFPDGGGFYIDPLKVLHVWTGASEPNVVNPTPLTIDHPMLKAFADTLDNSQQRDAAIVEGRRTTAPIGTPGPDPADATGRQLQSVPVMDASILDKITDAGVDREVRIGTQRFFFRIADGIWSAPIGTPQTTVTTADVPFNPDASVTGNRVRIPLEAITFLSGRTFPWIRIDEQYLKVLVVEPPPTPAVYVPRTGYGAMTGEIQQGATVTVVDSLANGTVTGRYDVSDNPEKLRPQPIDADVVMTVRSSTGLALHEHLVQDGRFSRTGAASRGTREVLDFQQPLTSIEFETVDLNAKPGRLQAYTLADGSLAATVGQYMILSTELSWPVWGQPPRRRCQGAAVHAAEVVDAWIVDTR